MKNVLTIIFATAAAITLSFNASAQEQNTTKTPEQLQKEQLNPEHMQRVEKREARRAEYEKYIDSLIISGSYQFDPSSFQLMPAGMMHNIYNPVYELEIYPSYIDVYLPFFTGITPPYALRTINYVTYDKQKYTAVQTDNGWTITFSSNLYSPNTYKFKFEVYVVSGQAVLNITNNFGVGTIYYGSIRSN